jgi:hypothetical protein
MDNLSTSNPKTVNPVSAKPTISHAPLSLGGNNSEAAPVVKAQPQTQPQPQAQPPKQPVVVKIAETATTAPGERITGMKTFFAKLHPGAITFLEEQIAAWLKDNPKITLKRTNIVTGDVQAKNTEPNIIIVVWY